MLPFPQTICYFVLNLEFTNLYLLAGFITTFLQTAANPSFRQNLLHSQLYRKHVLAEDVPGAPSINPPYLTDEMFSIIRKVRERSSMNITTMKQKDWTRLLTEDCVTMMSISEDDERNFVPCRSEVLSPTTDWELSWSNCRQPGVSTELASFLWLMLHNLMRTQARLHWMGAVRSAQCKIQECIEDGTLQHDLLLCSKNEAVGNLWLTCLQQHIPDLQPAKLLRLEFGDCGQDLSLAMTWLTAIILKYISKER